MNDDSILGSTLGQLGSVVKQTGKQLGKVAGGLAEGVEEQIGVKVDQQPLQNSKDSGSITQDKDTREVVEGFYAKSDNIQKKTSDEDSTAMKGQPEFKKMIVDKSPEEQKKLLQLHQQLHKQTYYDPTFNPPQKPEERPAEKVENEKKQEMQELQQKESEKPPPLVQRARERVEKFPGVSG